MFLVPEPGREGSSLLPRNWEFGLSEWDSMSLPDLCLPLAVGWSLCPSPCPVCWARLVLGLGRWTRGRCPGTWLSTQPALTFLTVWPSRRSWISSLTSFQENCVEATRLLVYQPQNCQMVLPPDSWSSKSRRPARLSPCGNPAFSTWPQTRRAPVV